ncbi:MAG: hypothetical protein Q4C98_07325, partial [Capnocytophaga sp.]|nr:hypothetical protein [Capnocytophaga sp.]
MKRKNILRVAIPLGIIFTLTALLINVNVIMFFWIRLIFLSIAIVLFLEIYENSLIDKVVNKYGALFTAFFFVIILLPYFSKWEEHNNIEKVLMIVFSIIVFGILLYKLIKTYSDIKKNTDIK